MSIWDPDPKQPRRRPDDDYDQTGLDLTLTAVIIGAVGLVTYYVGPLLWAIWSSSRRR